MGFVIAILFNAPVAGNLLAGTAATRGRQKLSIREKKIQGSPLPHSSLAGVLVAVAILKMLVISNNHRSAFLLCGSVVSGKVKRL